MDMEVDEDNGWSLKDEVDTLIGDILELSFSELKEQPVLFFPSKEEYGDYQCDNVGEEIKKHLEKRDDMIKEASIHDIGFVTLKLSGKWMAKRIHKMLRDGIETWAPKLYVGKVMIISPSLDNDIAEGTRSAWFRRSYIINTLIRMLKFSNVPVTVFKEYPQEDGKHKAQYKVKECFSIEERDGNVTISVGPEGEGERKPFIRVKKDEQFVVWT